MYELMWKIWNSLGKDVVDVMRSLQYSGTKGTIIFLAAGSQNSKNPVNVHDLEQKRNVFLLSKFCQNKGLRDKICLKFLWKTVVLVDNLHYATAPFCHIQCKIRAGYPPASEEAVSPSRQLQGFKLIVLIKEMTTLQSSYKQKYNTLHIDHIMCYLML